MGNGNDHTFQDFPKAVLLIFWDILQNKVSATLQKVRGHLKYITPQPL